MGPGGRQHRGPPGQRRAKQLNLAAADDEMLTILENQQRTRCGTTVLDIMAHRAGDDSTGIRPGAHISGSRIHSPPPSGM